MGRKTIIVVLTLTSLASSYDYNIDDGVLYSVKFNSRDSESEQKPFDEKLLDPPELLQTITMTTGHNEKYVCELPKVEPFGKWQHESYSGPNVLSLLEKLFTSSSCAYRLEHYWTYELCHGRYLRQYHEERDGKNIKVTEYFLGRYSKESFDQDHAAMKKSVEEGTLKKPQKKRIETMNMPYYELIMTDGTVCDLNGRPRTTRVQYVCYPAGKHEMYSFKESSTCEYEVIVLSPSLCTHPDYRPEESNERPVNCRPAAENTATKPLDLIVMEAEALKLRSEKMFQADMFQGDKGPGSVRIEIKPVVPEGFEVVETSSANEVAADEAAQHRDSNWPQHKLQEKEAKRLVDPKVVEQFLLGEHCLFGGSGWWKFEFCYGKKVDQIHEEDKRAPRTVVNLGRFDLDKHLAWIKENPSKRPKPVGFRKHVSHFYSDGDICDETGKPRQIEVKLKCKHSESPSAVSVYLLEPKVCEYILGVESPLVCDILPFADENGLMDVKRSTFDKTTTVSTTKPVPSEPPKMVQFTAEDAIDPKEQKIKDKEAALVDDDDIYDQIIMAEKEDGVAHDYEDEDYEYEETTKS